MSSHEREISVQQFCAVFHGNKILLIITHENKIYESVGQDLPDHMHYEIFLKKLFLYFISVKNCASDLHIAIGHHPTTILFIMAPQRRSGAAPSTANTGPKALIFEYSAHQGHRRA